VRGVSATRRRQEVPPRRGARVTRPIWYTARRCIDNSACRCRRTARAPAGTRLSGDSPERFRGTRVDHARPIGASAPRRRRPRTTAPGPRRASGCRRTAPCTTHVEEHHRRLSGRRRRASPGGARSLARWLARRRGKRRRSGRYRRASWPVGRDVVTPGHDLRASGQPSRLARTCRGRSAPRATACRRAHGSLIHAAVVWCGPCPRSCREDHHVSTSLFDEPRKRVIGRRHDGTPARRVRGTAVEALDEARSHAARRPRARRRRPRRPRAPAARAGSGRRGSGPGREKQRVHSRVPRRRRAPASFSRSRRCGRAQ